MLKLRHKISNPTVVSDPESASDPEFSDFHIIPPGEENEISSILATTDGHNSAPAPAASSSRSEPDLVVREPSPPLFDAEESSTEHAPSTPTIRPEAGESSPYPDDPPTTEPPTISRSLSTMKRDQTRLLSRDRQHSATDVLVQTPDGLHLTPGHGRVISTDESGAVASEVRDLREYIRNSFSHLLRATMRPAPTKDRTKYTVDLRLSYYYYSDFEMLPEEREK
ncbi:hypothetical protein B0H13DRAFT_2113365 [Mycena leptocephala]|nr:hypothetical protein B0H13DRAFT_2113365 [Mycena leptocephala]